MLMAKNVTQGVRPCQRKGCTKMIKETLSAATKYCSPSCRTMQSRQKRRDEEESKRTGRVATSTSDMKSDASPDLSAEAESPQAPDCDQLTLATNREEQLRRELTESQENNRQQQHQLTLSTEREAQLRTELTEAREHLRQQQMQLTIHAEQKARLEADREAANTRLQELTAKWNAQENERQELRQQLTAQEDNKPNSVSLDVAIASAEFLSVAEQEALQKVEHLTQWCDGIHESVHRLLPWVSHRAGPVSTWSQSNPASRSYWKHPLVPALGAALEPIARQHFVGSNFAVSKSVNQLLPFAVLAAQVYLAAILRDDKGHRPSDETTLKVVLASIQQAPELYPPTLLGYAREKPVLVQLATTAAITMIEQKFSRRYQQPDAAYAAK